MKNKILSEVPISASDVKEELKRIKDRDKELNFRAQKTDDYLNQQVTLDAKKIKELQGKLEKLSIPRIKEQHISKILDIMPATEKDVMVILQGYAITITKENAKKIAETVAEFVKK
jgi:DNA-directed RNA polymerase subunit F